MRVGALLIGAITLLATAPAAAEEPPICADRPGKANGTCTVQAGKFQVETGLIDWTRTKSDGVRSDSILWGSSVVKYGLNGSSDIEVGVSPLATLRVREDHSSDHESGFGDVAVRMKQRLTPSGASVQATLLPFAKLPTAARDLGNGKVEGGVAVPISIGLANSNLSLTLGPQLDLRADADGEGHHAAMVQLVSLGVAATSRLTLSAELWHQWDWDPAGTQRQVSADASAAYLLRDDLQLDAGANFGLNRATPNIQAYAGVSKRF